MKQRTIEDIFDKDIGHKGFAKFITLAQQDSLSITDIKDYNEKFKFKFDGEDFEFLKAAKDIKGYYKFAVETLFMVKFLKSKE